MNYRWITIGILIMSLGRASLMARDVKSLLSRDDSPLGPALEKVLEEQEKDLPGESLLESLSRREYQSSSELEKFRVRRGEAWRSVLSSLKGESFDLSRCLSLTLEWNHQVSVKRLEVRAQMGERLLVRSRFLPQLNYLISTQSIEKPDVGDKFKQDHVLRMSQTWLEFGRDAREDVLLRASRRKALFDYEDVVSASLSDARKEFFTILLRQKQLQQRRVLLGEFEKRLKEVRAREKARQVAEVDVLTAKLNVLNEEQRINTLKRQIATRKIELARIMGLPLRAGELKLQGEVESLNLPVESAIALALARSSLIAQAKAEVLEQERATRQLIWKRMPNLSLSSGLKSEKNEAGVSLDKNEEGTYALKSFVEQNLDRSDALLRKNSFPGSKDRGWFLMMNMDLSLFDGFQHRGRVKRETERLKAKRQQLLDVVAGVEAGVGKAYQTLLQRREQVALQKQTVRISKKRLQVQERLKELGKIQDNALETFRDRFFRDQDELFVGQIRLVESQENLRRTMRAFEPNIEVKK